MKDIRNAEDLVAAASRNGMSLNLVEAEILLGYMEGSGYGLYLRDNFDIWRRDDNDDGMNEEPYSVREVVEFAVESNDDLIRDESANDTPDEQHLKELWKDEYILEIVAGKLDAAIPPEVREYKVVIIEHRKKVVPVEAASWAEAKQTAEERWRNAEYILNAEDFAGVMFNVLS